MSKAAFVLLAFLAVAIIAGCSKKSHPATAANTAEPTKPVRKAAVKNCSAQSNNR